MSAKGKASVGRMSMKGIARLGVSVYTGYITSWHRDKTSLLLQVTPKHETQQHNKPVMHYSNGGNELSFIGYQPKSLVVHWSNG